MTTVKVVNTEKTVKVIDGNLTVRPVNNETLVKIGATGPQGPAGTVLSSKGTWTAQAYSLNDFVAYSGSSYYASQATLSTDVPGSSSKWQLIASKGADSTVPGPAGPAGPKGDTGAPSTVPGPTGAKGDTGEQGQQGNSGVIAVTAPITNTGTSTSANLGITTGTTSGTVAAGNDSRIVGAEQTANKDSANGYAGLDSSGKLNASQLPALAITSVTVVASQAAQLALSAQEGDVAVRSDEGKSYVKNSGSAGTMSDWTLLQTPTDQVLSVNSKTGAVSLTYSDVGAAASSHTHTLSQVTDAGTAAAKNISASGNAGSGEVVMGSDTRLSDARTPTTHTHTVSQITDAGGAASKNVGTTAGTVAAGDDSRITGAAQKASNLSDLASASTARTNLGLGDSATKSVGTTTGTIAAGDDSRITGAAQKASNLSDLASAATARTNLGLGNSATLNTGSTAGTVAAGNDARWTTVTGTAPSSTNPIVDTFAYPFGWQQSATRTDSNLPIRGETMPRILAQSNIALADQGQYLVRFLCTSSGTVNYISAGCQAAGTVSYAHFGIWTDNAGAPNNPSSPVASTSSFSVATGLLTGTLSSGYSLTAGTYYWLGIGTRNTANPSLKGASLLNFMMYPTSANGNLKPQIAMAYTGFTSTGTATWGSTASTTFTAMPWLIAY